MKPLQLRHYNACRDICISRGGKLLSETYVHSKNKLLVECANGHRWEVTSHGLKTGNWCPSCFHISTRVGITRVREYVERQGGELISTQYVDSWSDIVVRCNNGHEWTTCWKNLSGGNWCIACFFNSIRSSIEDLQLVANERGGKLISTEYVNNIQKLEWECSKKHRWYACWRNIHIGRWCPVCCKSRGERTISELLTKWQIKYQEEYVLDTLPNRRFDIQFEYQGVNYLVEFDGIQHFESIPFFDKRRNLEERRTSDILKTYTALTLGYKLIRIDHTKNDEIEKQLIGGIYTPLKLYLSTPSMYDWLMEGIQSLGWKPKLKMVIVEDEIKPKLTLKIVDE